MTNGDYMRTQMSDAYMAEHFCRLFSVCRECPLLKYADCDSRKRRLNWLKQEYKGRSNNETD